MPPPYWANRLTYAERFGIAPHEIGNTPAVWFVRWREWEYAKTRRNTRLHVEARGLGSVPAEEQRAYNDLMIEIRAPANDCDA